MSTITVVTSNPNKAKEIAVILGGGDITSQALEIHEIQSFDLEEIVRYKVTEAQKKIDASVLVEDVSFDIAALKGFPGPFVKFWEKNVGYDIAVQIAQTFGDDRVVARCGVGYADAERVLYAEGSVSGRLVSRREGEGFGFDFYFLPDGEQKTFSEMGLAAKNKVSHRKRGFEWMLEQLTAFRIL